MALSSRPLTFYGVPLRPVILATYLIGSLLFLIAAILYLTSVNRKVADVIYVFCALAFVLGSSLDIYAYNQQRQTQPT